MRPTCDRELKGLSKQVKPSKHYVSTFTSLQYYGRPQAAVWDTALKSYRPCYGL